MLKNLLQEIGACNGTGAVGESARLQSGLPVLLRENYVGCLVRVLHRLHSTEISSFQLDGEFSELDVAIYIY